MIEGHGWRRQALMKKEEEKEKG